MIERETERVSQLPPPTPRTGAGGAPPPPPSNGVATDAATSTATDDWDWDRLRDRIEWWFRPVLDVDAWRALGSVSLAGLVAPLFFALVVAAGALTFGLLFVVVGFLLIVPVFRLMHLFVRLDRRIIEFGGDEVELRTPVPVGGIGPASIRRAITDPVRWRWAGYLLVSAIVSPLLLGFVTTPISLVFQGLFGGGTFDGPGFQIGFGGGLGVFSLLLGVAAIGLVPRVAFLFARIRVELATLMVGADRLAEAEERVTQLSSQRSEILDAVANERRRIERNLHDGVQQQLVAIGLDLGMAEQQLDRDPERARELLGQARGKVQGSIGELRQLGRGLHPAILEDRGIDAALSAVVARSPIPVSVHVDPDLGLTTDVAETVYFVANEAIANVLKHAGARVASIHVARVAGNVRVTVHDDGRGGADVTKGTGLAGIRARVRAVDGTVQISSPAGGPTTIVAELPRTGGTTP